MGDDATTDRVDAVDVTIEEHLERAAIAAEARAARTASLSSRNPHLAHVDVVLLPFSPGGQLGEPEQHRAAP